MIRLSYFLITLLFFLLGPFMALAPRLMLLWPPLMAIAFLPLLIQHRAELRQHIHVKTGIAFLAALFFSLLSMSWSPSPRALDMGLGLLVTGLSGAILFVGMHVIDTEQRNKMMRWFGIGAAIGFALLAFEFTFDHQIHRLTNDVRADESVAENVPKRVAALFALLVWPATLLLEARNRPILARVAVAAFFLLCGFMTSRTALLAALLGMVVLYFASYQASLARWVLMAFIGFCVLFTPPLCAVLPLAPPEITGRFFDSAQHRMKIWELTARHVANAPIFGNGLDASRGIQTTVVNSAADYMPSGTSVISQHPHNIFLQLWLDLGLMGALLWGGLLMLMVDRTRFLPEGAQPYALAACYAGLTMLSTSFSILQAWWSSGYVATALVLMLLAYSMPKRAVTSGSSAGGIA